MPQEMKEYDLEESNYDDLEEPTQSIRYNPYKHLRFGSSEARELTKQYSIQEICKQQYPQQEYIQYADQALEEVLDANKYIKLSAFNPVKLFAYCFLLKSQISSKRTLELLRLPTTKSGKQFSILSKGRQIHQQYKYIKQQCQKNEELVVPTFQLQEYDVEYIKKELLELHNRVGIFQNCTIDVINKTAEILSQHEAGILKCQKKYKLIIQKIQQDQSLNGSISQQYANKLTIVLRKR